MKHYISPETEELILLQEANFLASITSDKPVNDAEEGDTSDWGWN